MTQASRRHKSFLLMAVTSSLLCATLCSRAVRGMSPDILEPQEKRAELVHQDRSQLEESTEKGGTSSIERSPFLKGRIPLKGKSLPEGSSSSLRRKLASLFKARSQPDPSSELGGRHPVKKQQLDILQVNKLQRKLFPRSKKQADKERNPQLYPYMPVLFAFGDSDFDAGNNLYLNLTAYKATKYPPYGESYFGIRGRFCDGRLIPDFLAQGLGLPIVQPYFAPNASFFSGTSFAVSGSGLLNSTKNVYNPEVKTHLFAQVERFLDFQKSAAAYWEGSGGASSRAPLYPEPSSFSKALYAVLIGGNDVLKFRTVEHGTLGPQSDAFVAEMALVYQQFVEAIYAAGGRNFVIFNLGNVGCAPLARLLSNGTCSSVVNSICSALANATAQLPAKLKQTAPEATVLLVDMYGFNVAVERDPSKFGVTNAVDACCGGGVPGLGNTYTKCAAQEPAVVNDITYPKTVCPDPSLYQYWDQFHLTQTMNRQLSHDVLGGSVWVSPKNVLQAFVVPQIESAYASDP